MNSVCRDIFKAIHEGKWLSIEYKNQSGGTTKYWIGIKELDPHWRSMKVEGLHLGKFTTMELKLYIDSILSSHVVDGSFFAPNKKLIADIRENPEKYRDIFDNIPNLKILEYLSECNKLDALPYKTDYALIEELDGDRFENGSLRLTNEQFKHIVNSFRYKENTERVSNLRMKSLGLNVASINTKQGLYVLAYRKLYLDVKARSLVQGKNNILNKEFLFDRSTKGSRVTSSIYQFLAPEDQYLLEEFEENLELIKDRITEYSTDISGVDDMPYIIAIGHDVIVDLAGEYKGIYEMYDQGTVTAPINAFFGDLTKRPLRKKNFPLVLLDRKINLDQLLAINNAVKYPLTYVQGPPGTGKTKTILYTIVTAFFNGKTVLFSSFNNHPIDEVYKKLRSIEYKGSTMPFPVLRIGNKAVMQSSLQDAKRLYMYCKKLTVYDSTLDKTHAAETKNMAAFTELMVRYEELLDLKDRREALKDVMASNASSGNMSFQMNMADKQLPMVEARIKEIGEISDKLAISLLPSNTEEMLKYLFFTSVKFIKRLDEPKNKDLKDAIVLSESEPEEAVEKFSNWLSEEDSIKKLLRVFPVVATTCISAHKLGDPEPYFDMTIMDEASQCNTAMSLVPIIRGESLMLVGDPQQLNPVIVMDPADNEFLKKRYGVSDEYDYIANSIYKTFLACDSVSDEILLRYHYRCHKKIIEFNNKKYYNSKLAVRTEDRPGEPLVFVDIEGNHAGDKNTAPLEAEAIVSYAEKHPDQSIGVITPFVNQKELITQKLKENGLTNITCGTVHAFQGDEKDVILFSLALTDRTNEKTYGWLKNNRELINVATSRARDQLVVFGCEKELERLRGVGEDDIYELVDYVRSNGESYVSSQEVSSRALGIKPYSSKTEEAFMTSLNHAMSNILLSGKKCTIHKEVPISHVFADNWSEFNDLFYTGRFDFVVFEKEGSEEIPILAIELDGKEHRDDELVRIRDEKKNQICRDHGFELIRVENSYARRYNYIKDILSTFFDGRNTAAKIKMKRK